MRAYALVTYPFACVPFLFLFFTDHGIDEGQYGAILSAYYIAMFVAEVPTGMLADRFGSKSMLVLGPLLLAAGFALLVLQPNYTGFLLGEVLLGLGHSVLSGPPTVALYQTLEQHGQQHRYLHEESRIHALRLYGTGGSFLLGGLLVYAGNADGNAYPLAIAVTCGLSATASIVATRLRNTTPEHTASQAVQRARTFVHAARQELRKTPVRWLLLYWIVLFALLRFPYHNYQPYLRAAGELEPLFANPVVVGSLFASLNLLAAPLSARVPILVERWGRRAMFWGMPVVVCLSLMVMAGERALADAGNGLRLWCWIGVSMYLVQQIPFAMHWPLLHEFVNHRIGSKARTTVLSVLSLGARAVYAGVNVVLFDLQARHGLATSLLWASVLGLLAAALVLSLRPRGLLRGDAPGN